MRPAPLCSVALLILSSASLGSAGCDDAADDNEAALPGVGPIGAGGAPDFGAGGLSGSSGQAGAGPGGAGGAGGASGASGVGGAPACAGGGEGRVRLAALRARAGKVDLCAVADAAGAGGAGGAADFATAQRLVRALGDAAHDGLAFGEVASPSTLAAGSWRLKVIDAADVDCTGTALAASDLCVAPGADLTLALLEAQLIRFDNAPATAGNRLRFIHAHAGGPGFDVGLTDPGTGELIPPPLFVNLTYGTTGPAADSTALGFPVLASGYLDIPGDSDTQVAPVGAAPTGTIQTLLSTLVDLGAPKGRVLTAYAAGRSDDAAFPLRGLLCDETKTSGALTACQTF